MALRGALLGFLLPVALSGCLWARGTADEPIVASLKLEGVKAFSSDEITNLLATRGPELEIVPPEKAGYRLDPDALSADAKRVAAFYRARGYYGARVERVEVVPDGPGRVAVTLHVVEGRPSRVRSLKIEGLDEAPEVKDALRKLPLKPGAVFTDAAFDEVRATILHALETRGYIRAKVKETAHVLPEEELVDVTYEATTGARVRFGPIVIEGAPSVPRKIVRDQVTIDVHEGQWFDLSKLTAAQKRVLGLGVFSLARVTPGPPTPAETLVPVIVKLEEAPKRTLQAGPGVALESIRWDARATGSFTDRNFYGDLRRFSINLQAGYAWLPTVFNRQTQGPVGDFSVEFSQPAALSRFVDVSDRFEVERGVEIGYQYFAQRIKLGFPLRLAEHWTFLPSYNLEVYELSQVETGALSTLTNTLTTTPLLENCPDTICLLAYLEERVAWDGRDNPLETHRGFYASLTLQEATNLASYGYRFFSFLPEVRGFLPLDKDTTLATRIRIGGLIPVHETGDPPIVARFFAGGPNSQRGYSTRTLSPLDPTTGIPVGANGLVDASLELRQRFAGSFIAVVFTDAAQVAGEGASPVAYEQALAPSALKWAFGAGLRYLGPFGPLRIDIGILPNRVSQVQSFSDVFNKFPGAVHFAIGEAF